MAKTGGNVAALAGDFVGAIVVVLIVLVLIVLLLTITKQTKSEGN